ncbi:MAG: ImmA/IrrE family metallo-endopeptidase, partial [Chitinispirillaceae bacterium]|nr:ImmA/IrrE family metallo-endopeptidase [Chitinispirillaceae bacterium]
MNEFASELLMPEKYFVEFIKNKKLDINLLNNIKIRFNVSLPAAAVRYTQLGKEPIAVIFSRRGKVKWKFESKDFPLKFIKYYSDIPENSGALEIFISKEESIKKLVSPNTWYTKDFNLIKYVNIKIEELSVFLPDNESILT